MDIKYTPEGSRTVRVAEDFAATDLASRVGLRVQDGKAFFVAWSAARSQYDATGFYEKRGVPFSVLDKLMTAYKEARDERRST